MSLTLVGVIWIVLSFVVATSFWFSLLQPFWFINTSTATSVGVYSYCTTWSSAAVVSPPLSTGNDVIVVSSESSALATSIARPFAVGTLPPSPDIVDGRHRPSSTLSCWFYGGRLQLTYMPSGPWQAACILLAAGAGLMSLAAMLAFATVFLSAPKTDAALATATGYLQIVAGTKIIPGSLMLKNNARVPK